MPILGGVNVMAIGDSNTYGFGAADVQADGAWRYHFGQIYQTYLQSHPNWVGDNAALGKAEAGNRMCGAIGQRIDQINGTYDAAGQFARYNPALALFLIGTNDCNQLYNATWAGSISESIANMSTLLDSFRSACPKGVAIVGKLPPSTTAGVNDQIVLWNAALDVMIAARSDLTYVFVADLYTAFTDDPDWATNLMWNFLHFSSEGHQTIADTFLTQVSLNIDFMPRATANSRRAIKPHTASLGYTSASTSTTIAGTTLDTSLPWAVSFDIDMSRMALTGNQGILSLSTDQGTQIMFVVNTSNERLFEFGNGTNFLRVFPNIVTSPNINAKYLKGWHQVVFTFDGVSRTTLSSYKMYIDGQAINLTSGAGLTSASNLNQICAVLSAGAKGAFDMADLTIWNGGSLMTAAQVANWFFNNIMPSGPTLIRRYQHTDASGSTLTDSTGNANGSIGTATWSTSKIPTKARTTATDRTTAVARATVS